LLIPDNCPNAYYFSAVANFRTFEQVEVYVLEFW